jgi:nucleoredoxin
MERCPGCQSLLTQKKTNQKLNSLFQVEGIPKLVILDPNGDVITGNARSSVIQDPEGAEFPWYPKPVSDLAAGANHLNEDVCLILFVENFSPEEISETKTSLEAVAKEHLSKVKAGSSDLVVHFFVATSVSPISTRIRELCQVGEPTKKPLLILLDIPDNGGFYLSDSTQFTADTIKDFLNGYQQKTLVRSQLSKE